MKIHLHSQRRTVLLAIMAVPLGIRSNRIFQKLDKLPSGIGVQELPPLSIIIPSRDEERNLKRLLPSLLQIEYPGEIEIIVVDDNSSDRTFAVAEEHGTRVVQVGEPPENCRGKQNASHKGALAAQNEWLLFTDADTYHYPTGLADTVAYAVIHSLDGLSLFPKQNFHGIIDHLVVTCAFASLFAGQKQNPNLMNGQFILIKKEVYFNSGGFMAVPDQMQDDLALGEHLARQGYKLPVLDGSNAESVFMYKDKSHMWQGITRLGAGTLRWSGLWSLLTVTYTTALMAPILALLGFFNHSIRFSWVVLGWAAASLSVLPWALRFGSGWYAILAPFGAMIMQVAAVWGLVSRVTGRKLLWKGRRV